MSLKKSYKWSKSYRKSDDNYFFDILLWWNIMDLWDSIWQNL